MLSTTLAARIEAAIGRRSNGNEWFAELVEVSPSSISRWRRGAGWPTPRQYPRLAAVLKISEGELADLVAHERRQAGVTRFASDRVWQAETLRLVEELRAVNAATMADVQDLTAQVASLVSRLDRLEQQARRGARRDRPGGS